MNELSESPTSEWPISSGLDSQQNVSRFDVIPVAAWRSKAANETEEQRLDRDRSIIAQNAGTTAAAIYNAVHGDGPWDPVAYDAIRLHVFNGTLELAGAALVAEAFTPSTTSNTESYAKPVQSSPSNSNGNDDHGAGIELKFGKYKGKTIEQVASTEDGVSWLNWAAAQSNNEFVKSRAESYLRANGLLETAAA